MAKAQRIDFDDLKARADFRAVLAHYGIAPIGQGEQAKVPCPFHDDERPSCSVNLTKGLWHCFRGCGAGNVLDFVHLMENRDGGSVKLLEAARRLADICGLELGDGKATPGRQERSRPSTWWRFDPRLRWPSVRPPWVEVSGARRRARARPVRPWPRAACSGAGAATRRSARAARPRSVG